MEARTTRHTVHFISQFMLDGFEAPQPPGDYEIESDEEPIQGATHAGYRRTATFIHLPALSSRSLTKQMVPVDPAELVAALAADLERM